MPSHNKRDVAGLLISPVAKSQLLEQIRERVLRKEKTFVVTPYSEFLYAAMHNNELRAIFNSADFAVADGVGILWADYFLSQKLTWPRFYLKAIQAWVQVVWTGASILLNPTAIYKNIPEKIVGADLIWDLAGLAEKNDFKVYLLGARGDIAKRTGERLKQKHPNLKIVGTSNKEMSDPTILDDINSAHPDMLLVAFKAQAAEKWISENFSKINATFAIGLGGTFDYIAGAKKQPPRFVRKSGLEWFWRLFTQPSRLFRIYRAFWGLIRSVVRYKVYSYAPLRLNACAVVINREGKILVCKRVPGPEKNSGFHYALLDNYWQFPQGGLDKNEDIIDGARRELEEETGIVSVKVIGKAKFVNRYEWNNARRSVTTSKYKYRGQNQETVFFKFIGDDSEIKLDQSELIEYKWLTPKEALEILAPERKQHAEAVLAELKEIQV